ARGAAGLSGVGGFARDLAILLFEGGGAFGRALSARDVPGAVPGGAQEVVAGEAPEDEDRDERDARAPDHRPFGGAELGRKRHVAFPLFHALAYASGREMTPDCVPVNSSMEDDE